MAIFPCIFSLPELNIKQLSAGYNYENESNIGDNTIRTLVFLGLKTLFSTLIWIMKPFPPLQNRMHFRFIIKSCPSLPF